MFECKGLILFVFLGLCSAKKHHRHQWDHHGEKPDCDENGNPINTDEDDEMEDEDYMAGQMEGQYWDGDEMKDCKDMDCDDYNKDYIDYGGLSEDEEKNEMNRIYRKHLRHCCDHRMYVTFKYVLMNTRCIIADKYSFKVRRYVRRVNAGVNIYFLYTVIPTSRRLH